MNWRVLLERGLQSINAALVFVAGVSLVVLIVIFGWLVYGRYILNATPTWVEQVALLIIVIITFFGAAIGIREQTHLSVEVFREMLPGGGRLALYTISDLLLMAFGGFMAFHGTQLALFNLDTQIPLLGISEAWRSWPLALGGALIALFSLGHIIMRFSRMGEKHEAAGTDKLGVE